MTFNLLLILFGVTCVLTGIAMASELICSKHGKRRARWIVTGVQVRTKTTRKDDDQRTLQ